MSINWQRPIEHRPTTLFTLTRSARTPHERLGQCSCRGKINDLPSTGTIQSAATLYVLRGERGSLSPLRSNKNTQTGGEGDTCARGDRFISKRVCRGRNACAMILEVFRCFSIACNSTRPRWIIIVLYTVLLDLLSSHSYSFLLHCWQLYTSYCTTILGCSYFRCGQTLRSLRSQIVLFRI